MHSTMEALSWGIDAGISTEGLEKATRSWLERVPGKRRRVRQTRTFHRFTSYEQTDNLLAISGMRAFEDEIDGHLVMVFFLRKQCVAMWYNGRGVGTFCMDFQGDDLGYAETDPFWPWQD